MLINTVLEDVLLWPAKTGFPKRQMELDIQQ